MEKREAYKVQFDNSGKLELELVAQSPMIHFQARQTGATIRASEVKPKLDRFLLGKLRKQTGLDDGQLAKDANYKDIFLPATDGKSPSALKYKMQIYCDTEPQVVVINNNRTTWKAPTDAKNEYERLPKFQLYFGNSGKNEPENQILGIVSNPTVCIHCFKQVLRELIAQHIEEFFLVTNFGTMQSKGFGGFSPNYISPGQILSDEHKRTISGYLKDLTGTKICYYMSIQGATVSKSNNKQVLSLRYKSLQFKRIEAFYRLMKSGYNNIMTKEYGRSYLFCYMHKLHRKDDPRDWGIGNEKAWMKQNGILLVDQDETNKRQTDAKSRYVRAFFGTTDSFRYNTDKGEEKAVEISSDEFERVPSPVFFKIIGDTVFITAYPVDKELYGKPFTFSRKKIGKDRKPEKKAELSDICYTPSESDFPYENFNMEHFMEKYMDHYNELVRINNGLKICQEKDKTLKKYLRGAPEVKPL